MVKTAEHHCEVKDVDLFNPRENVRCGLKIFEDYYADALEMVAKELEKQQTNKTIINNEQIGESKEEL